MKLSLRDLFWLAALVAMGCSPSTPNDPSARSLDGAWHGTDELNRPAELTFGPGNAVRVEVGDDVKEGTYRVNWRQSPPHLDILYKSGETVETLVDVIGDHLELQNTQPGTPRPKGFQKDMLMFKRSAPDQLP